MSQTPERNDSSSPAPRPRRSLLRRIGRVVGILVLLLVVAVVVAGLWVNGRLRASLPQLAGEVTVSGLAAEVDIERDGQGVPTIRAGDRRDAAFALGFLHGQERFFQMDLQRRSAAGELAEVFGAPALVPDRQARVHRFRHRASQMLQGFPAEHRRLIEIYTSGVNAGLAALGAVPFEYLLLRQEPVAWRPEDTVLTVLAMHQTLQGELLRRELGHGLLRDTLPPELVAFLLPPGDSWDAPLVGEALEPPPMPGPEVFDLREMPRAARLAPGELLVPPRVAADALPGSNAWAVAGSRTADGAALVANDMHLLLTVPNIWYRARLAWSDATGRTREITGATLPGAPAVVIGSNGDIAWGFTNAQADTADLVIIEADPADPDRYLTPDGSVPMEIIEETLRVAGGEDETLEVRSTIWGPIVGETAAGRPLALSWVAHLPGGADLGLLRLETAGDVDEAVTIATSSGVPVQNFLVADRSGRIAWTLAGRLPARRGGYDSRFPVSWSSGESGWDGLLPAVDTPRRIDPEEGYLWSANNRSLNGEEMGKIGDGGYVTAARAGRIRDRLAALDQATLGDMLSIQLDHSAYFLERWRDRLSEALERSGDGSPRHEAAKAALAEWSGYAEPSSVSYRLVRGVRNFFARRAFESLTAACREHDEQFQFLAVSIRFEGPAWRLLTEEPYHLLDPEHESWDSVLLAALDDVVGYYEQVGLTMEEATWGRYNTLAVQHPISRAVPPLGRWLDMPRVEIAGDSYMPRVVSVSFGASERMGVSPGREEDGYFHMPTGQSGHPMSPHYADSHPAWVEGTATPFLPGPTENSLRLVPQS